MQADLHGTSIRKDPRKRTWAGPDRDAEDTWPTHARLLVVACRPRSSYRNIARLDVVRLRAIDESIRWYDAGRAVDLHFREYGLVVELDGREVHAGRGFRDRRHDNRNARVGLTTLRYGWREIAADPCGVAAEIIAVLTARGLHHH